MDHIHVVDWLNICRSYIAGLNRPRIYVRHQTRESDYSESIVQTCAASLKRLAITSHQSSHFSNSNSSSSSSSNTAINATIWWRNKDVILCVILCVYVYAVASPEFWSRRGRRTMAELEMDCRGPRPPMQKNFFKAQTVCRRCSVGLSRLGQSSTVYYTTLFHQFGSNRQRIEKLN